MTGKIIAYYDDPLAAAWMGNYFQMQFTDDDGVLLAWQLLVHNKFSWWYPLTEKPYYGDSFYIHLDSLQLLEPKTGDFVKFYKERKLGTQQKHGGLIRIDQGKEYPWVYDDGSAIYASCSKPEQIIQRNGFAFHWPKFGKEL